MTASLAALLRNSVTWIPNSTPIYMRNPNRIKIPDLLAEVSQTGGEFEVSTHCLLVSEKSNEWASRYDLQTNIQVDQPTQGRTGASTMAKSKDSESSQTELDFLSIIKPALLAAICFPLSDPTPLLLSADLLTWLLLLQLRLFSLAPEDSSLLLKNISSNLDTVHDLGTSTGFQAAIYDILTRYQKLGSPGDESYSLERMKKLLINILHSFSKEDQENELDFKTYLAKEREEGWPQLLFLLTRSSLGFRPLDKTILSYSTLLQMENIASEILICASDLYRRLGRPRFSARSPNQNAIHILEHARSLSLQSAVNEIGDLCLSKMRDLFTLQAKILQENKHSPDDLQARIKADRTLYSRALIHCVTGLLYWAFETEWYFGTEASQLRLTLFINIPDDERKS